MFGLGGIDPKKMKQVQQVSKNIEGEIRVNYDNNSITITLVPTTTQAALFVRDLLHQFSETLATQLNAFFAISGDIVEVGKDDRNGQ